MRLVNIGFLVLFSCGSTETVDNSFYVERKLSFYDPSDENFSVNVWVRKSENIRTLHETFKKYGYNRIFSDDELDSNPCMIWSYIKKPCSTLIDSLIITYPQADKAPKYYREFWRRRKLEQNDTTVLAVLKEVQQEVIEKNRVGYKDQLTNDTIYNLIRIKFKQPANQVEAIENFNYLTEIGLNLSAYNLLYETVWYENFTWEKDRMKEKLTESTIDCCPNPIIVDDTK